MERRADYAVGSETPQRTAKQEWAELVQYITPRILRVMVDEDCCEITIHWKRNTQPKVKVTHTW